MYFADFKEHVALRQKGYAVLNACRWILNDEQPGHYAYNDLMNVNVVLEYNISSKEMMQLEDDAGIPFVDKWKGPICDSFKEQRKYAHLIPITIRDFMFFKIRGVMPSIRTPDWIFEADVSSDRRQNYSSHIQVTSSILEPNASVVADECL